MSQVKITPHRLWYNRVVKKPLSITMKGVILILMIPHKPLSLTDIFQDCQNKFDDDKPAFLSLLRIHIDMDEMIPLSFRNHFYVSTGISRKYPLQATKTNL